MSGQRPDFRERLTKALRSPTLPVALERALPAFRAKRAEAFAHVDFPAMRQDLRERKAAAIERLPELVDQFQREAEAAGCVVHRAATAEEACRIVGDIARRHGVRLAVKSKSMATEEIRLNPYLEAQGVRVVETDLGEWIAQLAGDHPSHLIAPILHLTREEIAAIIGKARGSEVPPEAAELVAVARQMLRQTFVDAEMGITGANAGIAETGSIVIVENEGNARLVSSLPPIHVAILGVEKIVPSLDDVSAILKMLPRSGTGQKLTTYVSFVTGPSRSADIELIPTRGAHGPKEVHLVLLDNGRWAAREDPSFREMLHCIRCGACANVCPPFQVVGGHAFGHVYTGPIGLMLTAFHHGIEHAAGPQSLCAGCNACETVCPVGIPIPRQIMDLRQRVVEKKGMPLAKRLALTAFADPERFDRVARLASLVQLPLTGGKPLLPGLPFVRATRWRRLPALARRPLRDRLAHLAPERGSVVPIPRVPSAAAGLTVAYFPGCLTDRLFPEMGEAVVHVLQALGVRVVFPTRQHCCGLPALNSGDRQNGQRMARHTLEVLERVEADFVLSHSTSCVVCISQDYPHLFRDDPDTLRRCEAVARRVVDFTTFLARVARLAPGSLPGDGEWAVTYHDACQSHNCLGLRAEPRWLLRDVLGVDVREMEESSVCCGFGGSFSIEHPAVAERMLRQKLARAEATGASYLVADNPGCLLHLRGGAAALGKQVRVLHLAELVALRLGASLHHLGK
ncbi:MAG TPA: LUD domain-containing protein [Chloroflexota bacterium]